MTPADLHKFADRLENLYALGISEREGIAAIRAIADARCDAGWNEPAEGVTARDVRFVPRMRDVVDWSDVAPPFDPSPTTHPPRHVSSWGDPPARYTGSFRADITHQAHQQGDEMACRCGKRWPVGEEHP